jgi:hypothetical protein
MVIGIPRRTTFHGDVYTHGEFITGWLKLRSGGRSSPLESQWPLKVMSDSENDAECLKMICKSSDLKIECRQQSAIKRAGNLVYARLCEYV